MATNPSILIRIAANLSELRSNLKESKDSIETTTQAMHKLAQSLDGQKLEQHAHNIVAAIDKVGGVSKLTEAEQARLLKTLDAWIEKAALVGKTVPQSMLDTAASLRAHQKEVDAVAKSWDGVGGVVTITEAEMRRAGVTTNTVSGAYRQFDGVLQALGINIGPLVKGIEDISGASGKTATQLGLVSTAGLAVGAAFLGWQFGRWIAEWAGLDKAVESAWRSLLNYKSVADETAAAKQDTINRAIANGSKETINYTEAIQFNIDAVKRDADAKINWNTVLAAAQRELRHLTDAQIRDIEIAKQAGATTEQLTNKFNLSALALKVLEERQRNAAKAADEHRQKMEALDKAYAKLMSDVKNANQLAIMEEEAAFRKQVAEQEAFFAEQEIQVRLRKQQAARDQMAADAAGEEARIAANQREIDAQLAALQATKDAGAVTKQVTDQAIAGYAGIATQIEITGEAIREWINLMRYSAQANAILSANSLFTTQSQRDRIAQIPMPRASGGPVSAGQPYIVGERRPELFVPSQSGMIHPSVPSGGVTVVFQPGAIVQHYPLTSDRSTVEPLMDLIKKELGAVFIGAGGVTPVGA